MKNNFFKYSIFTLIVTIMVVVTSPSALAVVKMNPDMSLNLLLLGKKSFPDHEEHKEENSSHQEHEEENGSHQEHNEEHEDESHQEEHSHSGDGFSVQELELYFKSNIDPYWSGQASLGIFQHERSFELELEEAFIESLFIPDVTLKAGKFYAFIGRHNHLHSHYYPFIDPPLVNQEVFGFHGWSGSGLSLAYLTPLKWYSEIILQAFYKEESALAGLLYFKNFWDIKSNLTLELDLSYGAGIQDFEHLFDIAMVWKWESLQSSKPRKVFWTTEWLKAIGDHSSDKEGISSYAQWQFLKNWWLEARTEYLLDKSWSEIEKQKHSILFSFAPTEYSSVRLQYDIQKSHNEEWVHGVAVQTNVSLGVHPAHLY